MATIKVIGYKRVSTELQKEDGYSLEYQHQEIEKYCEENSFELVGVYADEGKSGTKVYEMKDMADRKITRPGLFAMLDRLKQGDIAYVVVLATNRLWRSQEANLFISSRLKKLGVGVKQITQPMFTLAQGGTVDALLSDILVALDSYEVGEIRAKMIRGRLAKAQKGGYAGGKTPYGYCCQRHTKQLVLNEAEAQAVRELFILCAKNPGMTYREMAGILAAHGHTGRNGKPFSVSLAYNILQRADFYLFGRYSYAGIEVIGRHPPLFPIPMETTSEPKNMNRDVSGRDGEG